VGTEGGVRSRPTAWLVPDRARRGADPYDPYAGFRTGRVRACSDQLQRSCGSPRRRGRGRPRSPWTIPDERGTDSWSGRCRPRRDRIPFVDLRLQGGTTLARETPELVVDDLRRRCLGPSLGRTRKEVVLSNLGQQVVEEIDRELPARRWVLANRDGPPGRQALRPMVCGRDAGSATLTP
jgi:hypothetical protein